LFSQQNFSSGWKDNELKHLAERDDYYGSGVCKVFLTLRVRFGSGVAALGAFVAMFRLGVHSAPVLKSVVHSSSIFRSISALYVFFRGDAPMLRPMAKFAVTLRSGLHSRAHAPAPGTLRISAVGGK